MSELEPQVDCVMAEVKKIRLPDNTVVDINDSRVSGVDSHPVSGSGNVITSGGVKEAISSLNGGNLVYTGEDGDATIINGDSINVCLKGLDDQVASLTNNKQATLVSGTNIKTINSQSLLGSGNISITQEQADWNEDDDGVESYIKNKPDLSLKEDKANKVTSLSSSSTDTQYPSAKCVYDLVGDIESLLASI